MHEGRIDLNLLVVFAAVFDAGSVTQAAENLALSQPAVSHALRRLRDLTQDPLFTRTSGRLRPTARAIAMAGPAQEALAAARRALHPQGFDPAQSDRVFRIAASDYASLTLLPRLLSRLGGDAPGVTIAAIPAAADTLRQMAAGAIDCAFWSGAAPGAPFAAMPLFAERLVGVVRRQHALTGETITLPRFLAFPHAVVMPPEPAEARLAATLRRAGLTRRIGLVSPGHAGVLSILGVTDYVAVLPWRLAEPCRAALFSFALPLRAPPYAYRLVWHGRSAGDAGLLWLRRQIAALCPGEGIAATSPAAPP